MKEFQLFGKTILIKKEYIKAYEDTLQDSFDNVTAEYIFQCSGCTKDMDESEITDRIHKNIVEQLGIHIVAAYNLSKTNIFSVEDIIR